MRILAALLLWCLSLAAHAQINVLIVHGSSQTDALAMETLLEGRGDTATLADDGAIPGDISSYDVIVLADNAVSTFATLGAATQGIVTIGRGEWTNYGFATGAGASAARTSLEVKSTSHAIAVELGWDTLDALIQVATTTTTLEYINPGTLAAGGVRIADNDTTTDGRVSLFAFEAGAALVSGNAAGRRVGFGAPTPSEWNTAGNNVFFAAVDWAADAGSPPASGLLLRRRRN